jgi:hypothetical protein
VDHSALQAGQCGTKGFTRAMFCLLFCFVLCRHCLVCVVPCWLLLLQSTLGEPTIARHRLEIATGVAAGMAFIHDHGFIHCDLKPGNVLVSMVCRAGWGTACTHALGLPFFVNSCLRCSGRHWVPLLCAGGRHYRSQGVRHGPCASLARLGVQQVPCMPLPLQRV